MKNLIFLTLVLLMVSCSKEDPANNNVCNSAEINYYDWNPDTLVFDSILVDLDNDSFDDIKFIIEKTYQGTSPSGGPYYNYFARCLSVNSNLKISLGTEVDPSQQDWDCLEVNESISNDLTWQNSFILNGSVIIAGAIGIWDTNDSEGFIGLKFETNESTHFGWIKVSTNYNALIDKRYEITCFGYAISETNNCHINAGQME